MLAEREAILAADGIDPRLAVEMTRANVAAIRLAHEAKEKAAAKEKFMQQMRRDHARNREREARATQ